MLRKIWDRAVNTAVYQYQSLRQCADHETLDEIKRTEKQAREGTMYYYPVVGSHYGMGYTPVQVVKLTPEEQAETIQACEKRRAEVLEAMERRRNAYGLKH